MEELKKDLEAVFNELTSLAKKTGQLIEALEKAAKTKVEEKAKEKPARKKPGRKPKAKTVRPQKEKKVKATKATKAAKTTGAKKEKAKPKPEKRKAKAVKPAASKRKAAKKVAKPAPAGDGRDNVLKIIVDMRQNGSSYDEIAQHLQAEKIPTFSGRGQWRRQTVHKLYQQHTS